MNLESRSWFS